MTDNELQEIETRWQQARGGVWSADVGPPGSGSVMRPVCDPQGQIHNIGVSIWSDEVKGTEIALSLTRGYESDLETGAVERDIEQARKTADFIAHAHKDVPRLIAEIHRLREVVKE